MGRPRVALVTALVTVLILGLLYATGWFMWADLRDLAAHEAEVDRLWGDE
jgi:hypothetical protein